MKYLFKYIGILALSICLSASGFIKSRLKREEIEGLKTIESAFSKADDMLSLGFKSREEILKECFGDIYKGGKYNPSFPGTGEGISDVMDKFLQEFGGGDYMLEHNRITRAKAEISHYVEKAQAGYIKLSEIWRTAGVCAGLTAGIMLI